MSDIQAKETPGEWIRRVLSGEKDEIPEPEKYQIPTRLKRHCYGPRVVGSLVKDHVSGDL